MSLLFTWQPTAPQPTEPIIHNPRETPELGLPGRGSTTARGILRLCPESAEVVQSCPTLSDPMDCSLPGSSVHRIFQARVLEWGDPGGSDSKASVYNAGDPSSIPGLERSPGEGMAPHSSTLAWKIPWTEEPGRLQSMGSLRVGHD